MSRLPEEIIEENILTRLPVKSISRFRCVSRNWNHLFRNPRFIRKHLNNANLANKFSILATNYEFIDDDCYEAYLYSIDNNVSVPSSWPCHARKIDHPFMSQLNALQIHGSCNGLVCIEPFYDYICIWNPATQEYKPLPEAPVGYPSAGMRGISYSIAYGFGFDRRNDDYKVLRIVESKEEGKGSEASVYSLASDSWKELGSIPYYSFNKNDGILLNGVLHSVATVCRVGIKSTVVVCFDISDETFCDVPLPNGNSNEDGNHFMFDLGIWEGRLCLLFRNHTEDPGICAHQNDYVDVWTMVDNKWSKDLKITAQITNMYYGRPMQTLQNGEILLAGGPRGEDGIGLISYNLNLERARALRIHGLPDKSDGQVNQTYVETLVALNSGIYVRQLQRRKR